jgi:hypothetical protein
MRLNVMPLQNVDAETTKWYRNIAQQVNGLAEGSISALHQAITAAPTTGTWMQGDYVTNSAPAEVGSASSKYVILGWVCTVAGTPGTWLETRSLTGN